MSLRVAINGFGRIGRSVFRVLLGRGGAEVVAVNDLGEAPLLAHLLRHDSIYGTLDAEVSAAEGVLHVGSRRIEVCRDPDPARLPWKKLAVDLVVDATGAHTCNGEARKHLAAGAGRVIVSAPCRDADITLVLGVNETRYEPARHLVVSNASCTTNCLAPVLKVVHGRFGVLRGLVTTIHPYGNDQTLLDHPQRDLRRARAAALSLVPTHTDSPRGLGEVLPDLAGKLDGVSVRVPTASVCLADLTLLLERPAPAAELNGVLREAAAGELRGILGYTEEPLVSADYVRCPLSAVVDGLQTREVGGDLVKLSAWYDNEWGYANRLAELIDYVMRPAGR
jgi:glyceraldehyde 3-phosphate dehydrogenase